MEASLSHPPGPHDRPQPEGSDVRPMTAADVPTAAHALADAFYDDPLLSWVVPDDAARRARPPFWPMWREPHAA